MCDRPLRGFEIGKTKNGKPNYLICSSDIDFIYTYDNVKGYRPDGSEKWIKMHGKVPKSLNHYYIDKYQLIPCGSCLSCRLTRAAEMADRCMLEMQYNEKACFLTLTYDDEHIISTNYERRDTGEIGTSQTLFKKHYIDFIKRLRKNTGLKISYVLCGEYGSSSDRPHYHAIIFGYFPDDAVPWSKNKRGQWLYTSEELCKLWRQGYVVVGECTKDSANYVCRYVTKKLYGDLAEDKYKMRGQLPPFIVSSKNPAIGKRYFDDHPDCVKSTLSYSTYEGGHTFKPPRYFKKLYEKLDEFDKNYAEGLDKSNESMISLNRNRCLWTDMTYEQESEAKERSSKSKALNFKRDSV